MADLGEFLDSYQRKRTGPPCWLCSIPQREEIDAQRRERGSGCGTMRVMDWLASPEGGGYAREMATKNRIQHHFDNRHHER